MLRFYWFTCHSWELIAKAGLEGLSISPSMLHDFKIREMLNLSMASEGPTGPVLRVAITECRAGCVSIFSAKITHKFEIRFMKAILLNLIKTKRSLMATIWIIESYFSCLLCSVVKVLIFSLKGKNNSYSYTVTKWLSTSANQTVFSISSIYPSVEDPTWIFGERTRNTNFFTWSPNTTI